ncbi:MAG: GDSL-type esterase/lipase family protein [Flavobacteriales bacterium]
MNCPNSFTAFAACIALALGVSLAVDGGFSASPDAFAGTTPLSAYQNASRRTVIAERYPFLQLEDAGFSYPGGSEAFELVWSRMANVLYTGEGELNVVHMGGSHVQAGMIGHRMRELFNDLAPGSVNQRGLLVPFRVGKTNSTVFTGSSSSGEWNACRCSVRKEICRWGISGFTLTTASDSAALKLWAYRGDSIHYAGDRVRLYHAIHPSNPKITWSGNAKVIHSFTDSVHGFTQWDLNAVIDTLSFSFIKDSTSLGDSEVYGAWLGSSAGAGITWNDIGVNGASTYSFLRSEGMASQLETLAPDLVFFGIGVNDAHVPADRFNAAQFTERYDSLVAMYKHINPDVALVFLTNSDNHYKGRPNPNGDKVQSAMVQLARKHKGAVWDLYSVMGGRGSIGAWQNSGLAKSDKIHFTREGYTLQADLMYLAMLDELARFFEVGIARADAQRRPISPAEE